MNAAAFWGIAEELISILSFAAIVLAFVYVLLGKAPEKA
jgi:hypothetical protein